MHRNATNSGPLRRDSADYGNLRGKRVVVTVSPGHGRSKGSGNSAGSGRVERRLRAGGEVGGVTGS